MNTNLQWYFPSTDTGDHDGVNDSLRMYFEGDHERYIARETIQNSIDARKDESIPVKVEFERMELTTEDIPGIAMLREILEKAQDFGKDQDNTTALYNSALEIANSPTISVLRIGDYNTYGLRGGDRDKEKSWYRLVHSQGSSSMKGVGGGSFGIGKGAPFAASGIMTVFYSTLNDDRQVAFQGKARLSSFIENEDVRRGVGNFGIALEKGVGSVRDSQLIPSTFLRNEQGTDLFILGYKTNEQDWKTKLIDSILSNFWAAIHFGTLEVELKDDASTIHINADNLREQLETYSSDPKAGSLPFYLAVTDDDNYVFEDTLRNLGEVKLYVKTSDNYPKVVEMMRSPKMVVYPERGYRGLEPYAAVFICDDPEGNKKLRDLEPPKHNEWDPALSEHGPRIRRELHEWVKKGLRDAAMRSVGEAEEIPDLNQYLPEKTERDDLAQGNTQYGEPMNSETDVETAKEIGKSYERHEEVSLPSRQPMSTISHAGHGNDNTRPGTVDRRNDTHGDGTSNTEPGNLQRIVTSNLTFRTIAKRSDNDYEYVLILTPTENAKGALRLLGVGDGVDYPVEIESAQEDGGGKLKVTGAAVENISLIAGEQKKVRLRLKDKRRYILSLEAYEG